MYGNQNDPEVALQFHFASVLHDLKVAGQYVESLAATDTPAAVDELVATLEALTAKAAHVKTFADKVREGN